MNQYQPAPAGEIEVEIVAASIGDVPWKASNDNPKGECLRLRLRPAGNYAFVFADVPLDWGRMLENVRKAAGTSSDFTPDEYRGRRVRVVLKQYVAKDGTTRATVARWLPAAKLATAAPQAGTPTLTDAINEWAKAGPQRPATSKPSRNAPPSFGADDDIPF